MKRKTISILNAELIDYIHSEARRTGLSESRFMEDMLIESFTLRTKDSIHRPLKPPSAPRPFTFRNPKGNGRLHSLMEFGVSTHDFRIPLKKIAGLSSATLTTDFREINLEAESFLSEMKVEMLWGIMTQPVSMNEDAFTIPLLFSNITNVSVTNGDTEVAALKILVTLNSVRELKNREEKVHCLSHLLKDFDMLISQSSAYARVEIKHAQGAFVVENDVFTGNHYLDFFKTRYKRYKNMRMIHQFSKAGELTLFQGKYGYLYCPSRNLPWQFHELKEQYIRYLSLNDDGHSFTDLEDRVVHYSINEPAVSSLISSPLLKSLRDVSEKFREIIRQEKISHDELPWPSGDR